MIFKQIYAQKRIPDIYVHKTSFTQNTNKNRTPLDMMRHLMYVHGYNVSSNVHPKD